MLATLRIGNTLAGVARLHHQIGDCTDAPDEVAIGIETDRGLLVHAVKAAGYLTADSTSFRVNRQHIVSSGSPITDSTSFR